MSEINKVEANGTTYDLRDTVADTAAYAGLITVAEAILAFKEDSLTYSALVDFQNEMEDFQSVIMAMVGTPLEAETAADMTDTSKIYVYVGSESGYSYGYWYYYQSSTWKPGGVYNAVAVDVATVSEIESYLT